MERKLFEKPGGDFCPERAALALVGRKWVPHIVYELMQGKHRFNELAASVGGCNSRTLRDRLEELEHLGLVSREIVATMPPWVEYDLTPSGRALGEALSPIEAWGRTFMSLEAMQA